MKISKNCILGIIFKNPDLSGFWSWSVRIKIQRIKILSLTDCAVLLCPVRIKIQIIFYSVGVLLQALHWIQLTVLLRVLFNPVNQPLLHLEKEKMVGFLSSESHLMFYLKIIRFARCWRAWVCSAGWGCFLVGSVGCPNWCSRAWGYSGGVKSVI